MSKYPPFYNYDYPSDEGRGSGFSEFGTPEIGDEVSDDSSQITNSEINRVADEMIQLFDNVYDPNLLDPLLYIQASITEMVEGSSAPDELKDRVDAKTRITVSFLPQISATSGLIDAGVLFGPRGKKTFALDEIVTDSYRRMLDNHQQVQIEWPADFPADLIETLESADLQKSYETDVTQRLSSPDARFMLKLQSKTELKNRLEQYAKRAEVPGVYRRLAEAYGRGEATLEIVQFRSRTRQVDVAQALYLRLIASPSAEGLFIFLGATEEDAIVPLPLKTRRWFIESSPKLRRLILQRLPLYEQLLHGDQKLRYIYSFFGPQVQSISPLQFRRENDVFEALHRLRIKRMVSDIDTLVSTDSERLIDKYLEAGVYILQGLAVVATLPIGGGGGLAARLLVSFLLGQGAAVLEAVRGANADIPEEAEAHYKTALYAAVLEIVGPIAQKLLGKIASAASKSKISARVFKHLEYTQPYPGKVSGYDKIKPASAEVKRIRTELAAQLSEGPQSAQTLVNRSGRLFNKTVQGHDLVVYRGKVFRGDMRPPEHIFKKGFELRTPAAEIQKDIHQVTGVRGGFGGGHNALDIDGRGISTSAYYYRENVGAFVYGGQKGGYTYVIDARRFDGYHLYQNHHNALYPKAPNRIQFKPTEINYGHNIPPSAVLGAYNSAGHFIANPTALRMYAREVAIKEIRRLAATAVSAGTKQQSSEGG